MFVDLSIGSNMFHKIIMLYFFLRKSRLQTDLSSQKSFVCLTSSLSNVALRTTSTDSSSSTTDKSGILGLQTKVAELIGRLSGVPGSDLASGRAYNNNYLLRFEKGVHLTGSNCQVAYMRRLV